MVESSLTPYLCLNYERSLIDLILGLRTKVKVSVKNNVRVFLSSVRAAFRKLFLECGPLL